MSLFEDVLYSNNNKQKFKNKKIEELEDFIKDKKKEIEKEKNKIKEIQNNLNNYSYNINEIEEFINKFKLNECKLSELKLNISLLLEKDDKIISIIFISSDQNIHYSIICKNTESFSKIESLLYDKYPEYKITNNYFIVNGNKIDTYKNLKENNIKNSDIIMLKINN